MSDGWLTEQWDKIAAVGASVGGAALWTARRAIGVEKRISDVEKALTAHIESDAADRKRFADALERIHECLDAQEERTRDFWVNKWPKIEVHEARLDALEGIRDDVRSILDHLLTNERTDPGIKRR